MEQLLGAGRRRPTILSQYSQRVWRPLAFAQGILSDVFVHVEAGHTLVYRHKLEQYFSAPGPGSGLRPDWPGSEVVWVADLTELTRGLGSRAVSPVALLDEGCFLDYSCPVPADPSQLDPVPPRQTTGPTSACVTPVDVPPRG